MHFGPPGVFRVDLGTRELSGTVQLGARSVSKRGIFQPDPVDDLDLGGGAIDQDHRLTKDSFYNRGWL